MSQHRAGRPGRARREAAPARPPRAAEPADAFADVKQLGLCPALASLSYVFWIVGGMEMVERLAYYGVAAVATLYATDPVEKGGLGVTLSDSATILLSGPLVQSLVPVFTGGLSDRYGYKETIFASTLVKISGYLIMAFFPTYWGFFAGAIAARHGHGHLQAGHPGHAGQVHQPREQLDGVGRLLPDRQHRRLHRPARRRHRCASSPGTTSSSPARRSSASTSSSSSPTRSRARPSASSRRARDRREQGAEEPRRRVAARADEAPRLGVPPHLLGLLVHVQRALRRAAQAHRGLGRHPRPGHARSSAPAATRTRSWSSS